MSTCAHTDALNRLAMLNVTPKTVRDYVEEIQHSVINGDVPPEKARQLLARATALIGNCNAELSESEMAYHRVLLQYLDGDEAANRARIRAQVTPEWQRLRSAKDTQVLVVELVRSLKTILRSIDEEMRLAR